MVYALSLQACAALLQHVGVWKPCRMTPKCNSKATSNHKMTGQHSHQIPVQQSIDPGVRECTHVMLDAMISLHSPPYLEAKLSYLHHQVVSQLWNSMAIIAYSTWSIENYATYRVYSN